MIIYVRLPPLVSNTAGILLMCIGAFFVLFAWSFPEAKEIWVAGTGGLTLILLVLTVFFYRRLKDLEEKIRETQTKRQQ